jgi:hypothetical protein
LKDVKKGMNSVDWRVDKKVYYLELTMVKKMVVN